MYSYARICRWCNGRVHVVIEAPLDLSRKRYYLACFFSQNNNFLLQEFSQNSVFSQFQPQFSKPNGADRQRPPYQSDVTTDDKTRSAGMHGLQRQYICTYVVLPRWEASMYTRLLRMTYVWDLTIDTVWKWVSMTCPSRLL